MLPCMWMVASASGVFADWLDPVDAVLGIGAIVRILT